MSSVVERVLTLCTTKIKTLCTTNGTKTTKGVLVLDGLTVDNHQGFVMHLLKLALILIFLVAISGCKPESLESLERPERLERLEKPEGQGCILPPPEAASYPNAATLALAASYPDAVIGLISNGQDVEVVPPNMVAMLGDDVVQVKGGKVYVNEIPFGDVSANQTVKYKIEGQERHLYVGSELRHPIVENSVKQP